MRENAVSHDGSFMVRRGGEDRFFYDRWAGLDVDKLLLRGPTAALESVERMQPRTRPASMSWLSGAVFVDLDLRRLLYWAEQFFGGSALAHRIYGLALERLWPGWSCRWAGGGGPDFAAALGRELDDLDHRATSEPTDVAAIRAWCSEWDPHDPALTQDIAEQGEDVVRGWYEYDHETWITVRRRDGRLEDHLLPGDHEHVLSRGPGLVEALADCPPVPLAGGRIDESSVVQAAYVDEAARTIDWWQLIPPWVPRAWERDGWPGWTLRRHDDGPRGHMQRTGRSITGIRCAAEETRRELDEVLGRVLGPGFDAAAVLGRHAARLAAEHPGSEIVVHGLPTRPPIGEAPDAARIVQLFHALLREHG